MAVAPASMADKIIVLDDDDDEEVPQPSTAVSRLSQKKRISPLKAAQPAPTHIPQSPFATAKKEPRVLQAENEKLFEEFIDHCSAQTQDCPEVITFLQTKYTKASSTFLSSVEFRNFLGRCLTRAQANRSKTFVYINELCTVLRQHGDKKRQSLTKSELSTAKSASNLLSSELKSVCKAEADAAAEEEQPSTSGVNEDTESDRKTVRKSRKQIAYLENLLKVYNDEIRRLQESDLSLDDLGAEDSLYIQEHKLKRKMMKIYEKLCELKNCNTLTGRVLEQRISYSGSRFPEINKRIEKFINSPEALENPPDYPDIYQQVLRANERYNLCLPRKRLTEIAKEAFRDVASRIQDRRHLDLVFNFGSHLTDSFKPASDPAFVDPALSRKLRSNRELARSRLDEVISKYASKQEDTEEQERQKRTDKSNKEGNELKSSKKPEENGEEEEEEPQEEDDEDNEDNEDDEDDEDDQSSDPDIEEEIQASSQLDGAEGASEEEEESNEAEQAVDDADKDQLSLSVSASEKDEEDISDLSPMSQQSKSLLTPLSTSPQDSPSQSEPAPSDEKRPISNGTVESTNQDVLTLLPPVEGKDTKDNATVSQNGVKMVTCETSSSTSDKPRMTRAQKRKREEVRSEKSKHDITCDGDTDIPLDMGVHESPPRSRADTPPYVSSSQATPPPKKNKVNVATQCDPQEVIELSDSD
ncbi:death domain-associated protein 6 isoform X2 [Eucyclogobius newberryi]|uniref:death domain-associated protein 6 isoform X2 n=1 Tax=Eucyclogobius newberryi TaxID=166745 RepID=UPI003B591AAE